MTNKKPDSKEEKISIGGMHCRSCAEKIEMKLGSLEGVESIKVNLVENKGLVKFNPEKIKLETIKSEIAKLGYSADSKNAKPAKKGIWEGIMYGLIPHIGCIAFLIGSIFGVTFLMKFFKPLLLSRYFFHALILISLLFATVSSVFYLRKNGFLSWAGIKRKWGYLTTMYGSTIGINLLLFLFIFPMLANVTVSSPVTGNAITGAVAGINSQSAGLASIQLKVDIPCPGHAPLITNELKTISGVSGIQFSFPNNFDVSYDPARASKQEILALEVFKTYPATVTGETGSQASNTRTLNPTTALPAVSGASGGGCCGGGGSCGGSGGGCGGGCGGR